MADGATLDLTALSCVFGGHTIKGRPDGDVVSIAWDTDSFVKKKGIDGESYWIKLLDAGATITCLVQESSISNDILSGFFLADRQARGGLMLPLVCKGGPQERTALVAARARILQLPPPVWSSSGNVRAWRIGTTKLRGFIGGIGATDLGSLDNLPTTPG